MCRLQETCAICLLTVSGCHVYHTPCRHVYHKECYEQQLSSMRENRELCAVCRNNLEECIEEHPILSLIPLQQSNNIPLVQIDELTLLVINSFNDDSYLTSIYLNDTYSESSYQEDHHYWWQDGDDYDLNEEDSIG
jgi:hypothetical protein